MATRSTTVAKITRGYRSETNLTVANSATGTYTCVFNDLSGTSLGTTSVAIVDGTTVQMVMTAAVSADVCQPHNMRRTDNEVLYGRWYLLHDDGDGDGDTCLQFGDIYYQSSPGDTF